MIRSYFILLWSISLTAVFTLSPQTVLARQEADFEPGRVSLHAADLRDGGTVVLGDEPWRYQAGDNPAWADSAYDDAGWLLLQPDFNPDSLAEGVWTGIGWFRLHLQIDPELRNTTLALSLFQLGASEVYLDGEKVGGFGVIGASAAEEQTFNPKGLPLGLHLDDEAEHVLAVRYAYRSRKAYAARMLEHHPRYAQGFFMLVKPINVGFQSFFYKTLEAPFTMGIVIGVFLLLGGLHLLLYAFDHRERANLYFSILAFTGAVAIYILGAFDSSGLIIPDIGNRMWIGSVALGTMSLCIAAVYYQVFYQRLLPVFWVILCVGVLAFALDFFWTPLSVPATNLIVLVAILEGIRVTGIAIWKKKDGGWILGIGILFLLLDGMLLMAIRDRYMNPDRAHLLDGVETVQLWATFGLAITVFYLTIPITMSVLLAHRFSQTSRTLQAQLVKVQALSERTLAQEREKQALIAQQNERLEADVAERTAELRQSLTTLKATQAQLIQQEKMASLGQLTAGIAHEIKNPLNFINNFAEVNEELTDEMEEAIDAGEEPEYLRSLVADLRKNAQVINQQGRRADSIVRSMMQHASGGGGEREPTDVNALVAEYLDLAYHGMRAQVSGFKVEVKRDLDDAVGAVDMVPQEIGRVLLNLLGNAFDAVREHADKVDGPYAPTVTASTRRNGETVAIRITDNGPGIDNKLRHKIFEPFFTTKPTGMGTGLGLSLSYDIVTQGHGGTLTVEGEEGEGATFIVTLPVEKTERASSA